ncbi:MAG: Phosphopantetheine adenylyltransferase [uncultured bacterium]|nr:MAG: Phosphopantetheine adenylyltransferase [uncultured bacterium]OGT46920.1 MAG: pantetheine-phosphate adenylyltransferase [Gammaproteobacteria bacterium RIFCSPHIGHO2_12_FULL_38_11]
MKKIAIYPGTFDPITNGHVDIIFRAANLFDEVIVGIANSARKQTTFSWEDRLFFCKESFKANKNIRVEKLTGLSVDFAKQYSAQYIVRGIRTIDDVSYELAMAAMNKKLSHNQKIETIFLPASDETIYISSTMIREMMSLSGDISRFVPECVSFFLKEK